VGVKLSYSKLGLTDKFGEKVSLKVKVQLVRTVVVATYDILIFIHELPLNFSEWKAVTHSLCSLCKMLITHQFKDL
jgi:hypothetical protein